MRNTKANEAKRREAFGRIVRSLHAAMVKEIKPLNVDKRGGVWCSMDEIHLVLSALIAITASVIVASEDPFETYQHYQRNLSDCVREADLEMNSSEGKMLH